MEWARKTVEKAHHGLCNAGTNKQFMKKTCKMKIRRIIILRRDKWFMRWEDHSLSNIEIETTTPTKMRNKKQQYNSKLHRFNIYFRWILYEALEKIRCRSSPNMNLDIFYNNEIVYAFLHLVQAIELRLERAVTRPSGSSFLTANPWWLCLRASSRTLRTPMLTLLN